MTAKSINNIINLKVKHCLYRNNGYWYHHLTEFPAALFDKDGFIVFNTRESYNNNTYLRHSKGSLHVDGGISSIPGYTLYTTEQRKKLNKLSSNFNSDEETVRKIRQVKSVVRNQSIVEKIKKLYNHQCQICGTQLKVGKDKLYSEIHHIKPLGIKHKGPDIEENLISVCPNDHVLLDLGAIDIDMTKLIIAKHKIRPEFIVYHNSNIFGK